MTTTTFDTTQAGKLAPMLAPIAAPDEAAKVVGAKVLPADLQVEYVAGGAGYGWFPVARVLRDRLDDAEEQFGDDLYDIMRNEPAVGGSLTVLKLGVLSGEATISPRVQLDPGQTREALLDSGESAEKADTEAMGGRRPGTLDRLREVDTSKRVADFCQWAMEECKEGGDEPWAFEMLDAWIYGTKLSEKVLRIYDGGGEWDNHAIYERLPVKPRKAWSYVVDRATRWIGVYARSALDGLPVVLPPEKFARLAWDCRDGDPRGHSVARPAYKPWDVRSQLWPEFFRHLKQHARASVVGTLPPDAASQADYTTDGRATSAKSPTALFYDELGKFQNGSRIVIPNGAKVELLYPEKGVDLFTSAFDFLRNEIVYSILLQVRATLEAEHGSKADSQTGQDILGTILLYARRWFATFYRRCVLYDLVLLNFGEEVARTHTPTYSLGKVEHQDVAALIRGLASIGYKPAPSHLPMLDTWLNLPPRGPEEIRAAVAMQEAAAAGAQQLARDANDGKAAGVEHDNPDQGDGEGESEKP